MNKQNASGLLKLPITTLQQCCKQHYYSTEQVRVLEVVSLLLPLRVLCWASEQTKFPPKSRRCIEFQIHRKQYKTSEPQNDEI